MSNSKKRKKMKVSSKKKNKRVNSKLGWTEGNKTISTLKKLGKVQQDENESLREQDTKNEE
jgi:hypothetical protein